MTLAATKIEMTCLIRTNDRYLCSLTRTILRLAADDFQDLTPIAQRSRQADDSRNKAFSCRLGAVTQWLLEGWRASRAFCLR